jgi:hypothetical protein
MTEVAAPTAPAPAAVTPQTTPTPVTPVAPEPTVETPAPLAEPTEGSTIMTAKPAVKEPTVASPALTENKASYAIQYDAQGDVIGIDGLTLPEDEKIAISKEHLEDLTNLAREKNLSPEQAQMLLERENKVLYDAEKARESLLAERRVAWKKQTMEDPEIGGSKFAETQDLVSRVISEFASPALKKQLDETGLGNHTELNRLIARFARKYIANDRAVFGDAGGGARQLTKAERWYGASANG